MEQGLAKKVRQRLLLDKRRKRWINFVRVLGCVVVFCTTYALILPAITLQGDTWCGVEEHFHDELCSVEGQSCEIEEHIHDLECYSNPEADLETIEDWELSIPQNLSGVWADDLIEVAKSQLGYEESIQNYILDESSQLQGYTRYGAWYGDPYSDWNEIFVSFCLNYANISEEYIVRNRNCSSWVQALSEAAQFVSVIDEFPEKGDLIFLGADDNLDEADRVGLVVEVDSEGIIKTIEGDLENKVQYGTYKIADSPIIGYGKLPINPAMQEDEIIEETIEDIPDEPILDTPEETAPDIPMMFALAKTEVNAGKYGNYSFSYNKEDDAFTTNPAYAKYYNEDSPLGVAGSFHIVAFDTAVLNTHTNGNILARTLRAGANFGTNNYKDELSYVMNYQTLNSTSASMQGHILVVGSENTITIGGNRDIIYINGVKIDKPNNIVQDLDSEIAPFIDLTEINLEIAGISSRLAGKATTGVSTSFQDQNNRQILLEDPNSIGYYNIKASELKNYANNPMRIKGFSKEANGALIINVDCTGVKTLDLPPATIFIDNQEQSTNEVTEFSNGKVIWNFVNAAGVEINTNRMTGMVIALGATVNIKQNLNGTVIAENVNVQAESHRTDFTGEIEVVEESDKDKAEMGIRKVDSKNISIYLPEAQFSLYKWNGSEYQLIEEHLTTDLNGLLKINGLDFNRAYRLIETTAPVGYMLDATPYDFYVPHSDKNKYPNAMPANYAGEAHGELKIKQIKNMKSETFQIRVEKEWYIGNTQITWIDGLVNVDVYQKVYSDGERTKEVNELSNRLYANALQIDSHNNWQIELKNLPGQGLEEVNGETQIVFYSYYVEEEPIRGYEASYKNNDGVTEGTITIKNTSTDQYETTEISVEKEWYSFEGTRIEAPANSYVSLQLYQTAYEDSYFHHAIGEAVAYGEVIELSEKNQWKCTFSDLPEFEILSTKDGPQTVYYSYSVREKAVGGFSTEYTNNDVYEGVITVKNRQKDHPTGINIKKIWKDENDYEMVQDGEITVDIYQKAYGYIDEETYDLNDYKGSQLYEANVKITSEDGWKKSITGLPLHGWRVLDGESVKVSYTYYVQERETEGYKTTYENNQGITGKEMNEQGEVINTITIINKIHAQYTLPDTGGNGTQVFVFSGLLLMCGSLLGYELNYKRKEKKL